MGRSAKRHKAQEGAGSSRDETRSIRTPNWISHRSRRDPKRGTRNGDAASIRGPETGTQRSRNGDAASMPGELKRGRGVKRGRS